MCVYVELGGGGGDGDGGEVWRGAGANQVLRACPMHVAKKLHQKHIALIVISLLSRAYM